MASGTNFTADNFPRVKVLYNYDYEDEADKTRVWMKEDEVFYLLNSDGGEWWQVCRPDSPQSPFYVPSTYVEVLSNISGTSSPNDSYSKPQQYVEHVGNASIDKRSSFDTMDTRNGVRKMSTFKSSSESDDNELDYENAPAKTIVDPKVTKVQYVPQDAKRPTDLDVEDDYVNLEKWREQSGLPSLSSTNSLPSLSQQPQTSDEGNYANLQDLGIQDPMMLENPPIPDLEHSQYQKTLQDMWEVYLDSNSNRLFYVHKETKEKQWKPPRGHYHAELQKKRSTSDSMYEEIVQQPEPKPKSKNRNKRISRSFDCGRPRLLREAPDGWTYNIKDTGEEAFINNETKQERSGGSTPTKSPTLDGDQKPDFSQSLLQMSRHGDRAQVSDRFAKTRSVMIENLHFNMPPVNTGPPPPKSATLPPNFSSSSISEDLVSVSNFYPSTPVEQNDTHRNADMPSDMPPESRECEKSNDIRAINSLSTFVNINEPIEGWLNKCKIQNGKKSSKKWAYLFVKLGSSNLVFYKDQKSVQPKSGFPHGKYEQIVSLATCSIDKEADKITSKKNTLVITCDDSQILLQAEDDVKMQEWFVKIHTRIKELGGCPDTPASGTTLNAESGVNRKPSFKDKKHDRKPSDSGTLERRGKIKNVLERFMTTRSDKDKLVKKGIYKDTVFGADLKQICAKEKTRVPKFVESTIASIEKRGLDHEGIYRVGGNVSQIQKVRMMVDQGEKYDANDPMWDVNVLTGSLKLFFRELKDPLFTSALFDKFLKSYLLEKGSDRLKAIKATMEELPKPHYDTIKMLFRHLLKVMELSAENKMTAHTLAIVFGPTLIWPEVQHQNLATSMVYQSRIVEFVLHEYKNIFR